MKRLALAAIVVAVSLPIAGQASAWQLGYKEQGVCVTQQPATGGAGMMEIAYLPQGAYLIKFSTSGTLGDKIEGIVSVKQGSNWTEFPTKLQLVNDVVLGVSAYSYEGMSDALRGAVRSGSTLKYEGSEFSLSGSSAALEEIVSCVKSRS